MWWSLVLNGITAGNGVTIEWANRGAMTLQDGLGANKPLGRSRHALMSFVSELHLPNGLALGDGSAGLIGPGTTLWQFVFSEHESPLPSDR